MAAAAFGVGRVVGIGDGVVVEDVEEVLVLPDDDVRGCGNVDFRGVADVAGARADVLSVGSAAGVAAAAAAVAAALRLSCSSAHHLNRRSLSDNTAPSSAPSLLVVDVVEVDAANAGAADADVPRGGGNAFLPFR